MIKIKPPLVFSREDADGLLGGFFDLVFFKNTPYVFRGVIIKCRFKKFFPLLWANLIHSLAYGIGFIMLVLPGFYLYSRLGLFSAYIMFEGKSAMDAISESWQDTETHQIKLFVLTSTFLGIQILFGLIGSFGEGSLNTSLLFLIAASLVKYMTLMPLFYLYFSLYQSLKK